MALHATVVHSCAMRMRARPVSSTILAAFVAACGDSAAPVTVATVEVTSPLGTLWDAGTTVQLSAVARDAQGNTAGGVTYDWTSSNAQVATVDLAGRVQALAVGTATIRAEADGTTGSLQVRVVDADLAGITTLAGDAYLTALVTGATNAVRGRLQAALQACTTAAGQANLEDIQQCVTAIRTEAAAATDPTDRALLAVLGLFADQFEHLLDI